MRRRDLLASTLAACTLVGCIGEDEPPSEDPEEPEEPEDGERVQIIESVLVREDVGTDEETVAVSGVAELRAGEEVSYVEIRAEFYDVEGELLDTTIEQAEDVSGGERWEFTVVYPQIGEAAAEVESYELEVGTEL